MAGYLCKSWIFKANCTDMSDTAKFERRYQAGLNNNISKAVIKEAKQSQSFVKPLTVNLKS